MLDPHTSKATAELAGMTAYLAADGFVSDLVTELGADAVAHERLVLAAGSRRPAAWAANVWIEPIRIQIKSISSAVRALRDIQRDWALYSFHLHRRAQLIAEQLPTLKITATPFPAPLPKRVVGSWTLLDEHTLLASPHCSSPFPHGEITFQENHTAPPSRAYLKLWELFSRLQVWPRANERCVDMGASPGGWTWVLQGLGARVIAVDKAPLAPRIACLSHVDYRAESAFALDPSDVGSVDWLFSDVVCYPARLLKMVERWRAANACRNIVCTLKFQGPTDPTTVRAFAAIPGSRLIHLNHNRHELTWFCLAPELMPASDI